MVVLMLTPCQRLSHDEGVSPSGEDQPYERIKVRAMSPTIGGEVSGVDLNNLDDDTFAEIHRAFLDRGVLFFRNQDLSPEAQIEFARRFGEPEIYPFKAGNANFSPHPSGFDEIVRLEHDHARPGYENVWHTDVSWMVEPSLGSVLRAIELPDHGGDTLFADARQVYDSLHEGMKTWIDGLEADHDWLNTFGRRLDPDVLARFRAQHPGATHPVVRTHPETGRKSIYISPFVVHVRSLDALQSRALLDHLVTLISRPDFHCRFTWDLGSVAVWDNRCVFHYAVNDYYPKRRVMDRVTIAGDKPF